MQVKLEAYVKEWLEPVVRFVDMPERKIKRNIALMQSRVKCIKYQNKRNRTMKYIFDIDGTLADCSHRLHFIQPPESLVHFEVGETDWKPD